jgi:hypothetical protein
MKTALPKSIPHPDAAAYLTIAAAKNITGIAGVRIYDVGQGDGICILDQNRRPFLQIDYGGLQGHPFSVPGSAEARMPLAGLSLLMLSHWDRDHWLTAEKNGLALQMPWLVPRQTPSPAAVTFSMRNKAIRCIPEDLVGRPLVIACGDDYVMFEKLEKMPDPDSVLENCNRTGVAFSAVNARSGEVILLPGDARFRKVQHYSDLCNQGVSLRGLVAFHHGSGSGWRPSDSDFLAAWHSVSPRVDIVFSYAEGNSYRHPDRNKYLVTPGCWTETHTPWLRNAGQSYKDILF